MKYLNKILLFIAFFGFASEAWLVKLSELDCSTGSVLPYFVENGTKYVILGREAHGKDQGTYDDFGGSLDATCDVDAQAAAAREFSEEAILRFTVPLFSAKEFIDPEKDNTKDIIAFKTRPRHGNTTSKFMVTFIVDFS